MRKTLVFFLRGILKMLKYKSTKKLFPALQNVLIFYFYIARIGVVTGTLDVRV